MHLQGEDRVSTRTTVVPFAMSTCTAADGNISLAQNYLMSSTCVEKKGEKCPKASLRPLALGCVATSHSDAHHQTQPLWPFASTAFPSGHVSCFGPRVQRCSWGWHCTQLLPLSQGNAERRAQGTPDDGSRAQGLQGCSQASAEMAHTYSVCVALEGCGSFCLPSRASFLAGLWPRTF